MSDAPKIFTATIESGSPLEPVAPDTGKFWFDPHTRCTWPIHSEHPRYRILDIHITSPVTVRFALVCLLCFKITHNPNDVQHRYCGHCHKFLEDAGEHQIGKD